MKRPGIFITVVFGLGLWGGLAPTSARADWVSFGEVRERYQRTEGSLLDRHGEILHERRVDPGARRLAWTPLAQISEALRHLVVVSEDRRFLEHHGVDWKAMVKATARNLIGHHPRGASTLSMQLVSMLDSGLTPRGGHARRGVLQKFSQMRAALELDGQWSKDQILEAYLNLVSFRGELQGVAAASQGLFGKAPHGLSLAEAAILAALLRSPEAGIKIVSQRACALVEAASDCDRIRRTLAERPLLLLPISSQEALAPHLAARLLPVVALGASRSSVHTTLDAGLQRVVNEILSKHILSLQNKNARDAAALIVDNASGQVIAYVGGIGDKASARFVDGVQARRQAGSTLKPFLYGLAFERRYLTPSSVIEDSPTEIAVAGGMYRPQNYDHDFHGRVTVREALASSLNVVAVKTLGLTGVGAFVRKLEQLGFSGLEEPAFYGPSLALGSADVTLWDLVNAYRTLANQGRWSPLSLLRNPRDTKEKIPGSRQVFSNQAAFLVSDVLADRDSRNLTFGLENPLSSRFWTAAKTGTSKDMRDNWCVGYSQKYTVGIWVGNSSGLPMWDVTGISGAAPAWAEIMNWLHRSSPSRAPKAPSQMVALQGEWFIAGTEGSARSAPLSESEGDPRITYPGKETIIALDPDMPEEHQRVLFRAEHAGKELHWILNGEDLGEATSKTLAWQPVRPGAYVLALRDSSHFVRDAVHFSVRGSQAIVSE